jgi:cytochrome P450
MSHATLEIVVETLFGTALGSGYERVGKAIDSVMTDFQEIIQTWRRAFPEWVPFAARRRTARTIKEVDAVVLDVVKKRRASGELGDDLLSRLLVARDEADPTRGMDDQQLRDAVMTLFIAGHETTANALAWTLMLLADHPEIDARLAAEVGRLEGRAATANDLPALTFTDAVLKEALRLYPPAHIIGREATRDVRLGPWTIQQGTAILISPWALHHDRRFFDDPEAFRPERWLDGSTASLPRYAYMPFGGGTRICVGNHFAIMESVLVLATLAQRVRFERISRASIATQPAITLRPKGGLPLRVKLRTPPQVPS